MSRYEVVFSARALVSLKEVTRYIAEEAGTDRATDWLAKVRHSTFTLETHPYARRIVGVVARGTYLDRAELDALLSEAAEGPFACPTCD